MTEPASPPKAVAVRDRIDQYLAARRARPARCPRVVPLTGDASDRRYFRIIAPDGRSIVLALHADAIDFDSLPFANVARLLQQVPLPVPAILGPLRTRWASSRCRIWAT